MFYLKNKVGDLQVHASDFSLWSTVLADIGQRTEILRIRGEKFFWVFDQSFSLFDQVPQL